MVAFLCALVVVIVLPLVLGGGGGGKKVAKASKLILPVGRHDPGSTAGGSGAPGEPLKSRPVLDTIEHEGVVYLKPVVSPQEAHVRLAALEKIVTEHRMNSKWTGSGVSAQQAMDWMAQYDPARLDLEQVDVGQVLQRYALAVFFFSTHPGTTANRTFVEEEEQEEDSHDEYDEGEDAEDPTREQQDERRIVSFGANWMMDESICTWQGVHCANKPMPNVVVHLNMSRSMLQGTLPPELALLKELQQMDLAHNDLEGGLPDVYIARLSHLEALWLQDNLLTGVIPDAIGEWSHLTSLNLAQNKFSGNLPTSMAQLTNAQLLFLQENLLSGSIPSLGNLKELGTFWMSLSSLRLQISVCREWRYLLCYYILAWSSYLSFLPCLYLYRVLVLEPQRFHR